ncbi:3-oxoacyl-[acyl-carrier protein] reductase [Marininema mesophilum]|uniref:3-oxoacyl-[acyl-carrier protein] reductase n=1 Tax=Marininema mesophilum TaxID=1048340 RepID=A0A1H2YZV8_9BACL|nr:SDR family oxidoreductase [Marininema mesophilum]SDX10288.1 3-oxoacyl-[acyl-carrier protein] reductase [Marininema mesophilum]
MTGSVAWVTGGATGLGVQVAKHLATAGYHIAINYRTSQKQAEELVQVIQEMGQQAIALQGDVSNPTAVKRMVKEIHQRWGRLDVLVCAAGPFLFQHISTIEFTDDQWREMVDGNLSSVFYCAQAVLPMMREQGWGRIITFGFPEVETAPAWPGFSAYAAAKAGVVSLTRSLAQEEASHGVTVNMVYPGDIRHPFKEAMINEARGKKDPQNPIGRSGTGEDLARVIQFLVHRDSDFITGAVVPVTGGFDNRRGH